MSFNVFRNNVWDLAQRLKVFRTTVNGVTVNDWYLAKKISAWRGPDPGGFWQTVYPDLPFNPVVPTVQGTPIPGFELSLSSLLIWDFSDYRTPDTITYQWQRSTAFSTGYTDIPGATSQTQTYIVQSADIGNYIRCRIRGTNERGFFDAFSSSTILPVGNPDYTFNFGASLGVNANAYIMFDPVNGVFPSGTAFSLFASRILRYFTGGFKHFRIWYKSDETTFRIYHQMYRDDQVRDDFAGAPNEVEIVFTNGSNVVDIYVVDAVSTTYIDTYTAWQSGGYSIKTHPSASYAAGRRFRVTMDALTSVSVATTPASTTFPSTSTGWIFLTDGLDSTDATVTFTGGSGSSSPTPAGVNGAFTKSNMFFPTTPTVADPVYATATTATVSWSGSNANGYYVTAARTDNGSNFVAYNSFFGSATTSTTLTGLVSGATYTVSVSPISRGAPYDGQFGFAGTKSYSHVTVPSVVQNLTATSPTQTASNPGDSGGLITYTVSWSAPATGAPITRYEYDLDVDAAETGFGTFDGVYTSNGTSTTLSIGPFSGLQLDIRVRAVNAAGAGPYTEIRLNSSPSAPGTPTFNTNPIISSANAQVSMSWNASNARGGSGLSYRVYRGQNTTTIATDRSGLQTSTSYSDNIAGSVTSYYYRVVPQNTLGSLSAIGLRSGVSNEVVVTQPTASVLPLASTTARQVSLLYTLNGGSGSATSSYTIYRGQNTNPINSVTSGQSNVNNLQSVADTGTLALGTTYYYKVSMTNNINSVESGVASVTTPTAPGQPGRPVGTRNASGTINVTWSASTDGGGGTVSYEIFRGQNATNLPNTNTGNRGTQTLRNLNETGLNPGATYFYRVVPTTVWATGSSSNVSAGTTA